MSRKLILSLKFVAYGDEVWRLALPLHIAVQFQCECAVGGYECY